MSFIRSFSQMPNMSKCTLYLRAWRMCWSDESGNSNEMSGLWFRVERMRQWVGRLRLQAARCRNKCRNNSYLARIDEDFWLCDEFPWFPSHLCPVSSEWWLGLMRLGQDPILSHWRLSLPALPSCTVLLMLTAHLIISTVSGCFVSRRHGSSQWQVSVVTYW